MKIRIEIEIDEDDILRAQEIGQKAFRKVNKWEIAWWKRQEELVGAKAMTEIGTMGYGEVK